MAKAERKLSPAAWGWVLIACLAAFELMAHPLSRAAVPGDESWEAASAFVRERFENGDRIVAAPAWADPIVRLHLGDLLPLRAAAPPGPEGIRRIWELGIRGQRGRAEAPELEAQFGPVQVRMWTVRSEELVYDFTEEIEGARVELVNGQDLKSCPWTNAPPSRAGLGGGPMAPAARFVCDRRRPWLWVGPTVLTDLELEPRRCVSQHPAGADPVRVIFENVPLGERILVRAGVDYEHERWRAGSPVRLRVSVGEDLVAELRHEDGDGWSELELDTRGLGTESATVRFETRTDDPSGRVFCWSARSVR